MTDEFKPALDAVADAIARATDLRPVAGELQGLIRDVFRKQFETRGSYGGTPWAPLVEGRGLYADAPLRATDHLFRALTEDRDENEVATRDRVAVGLYGRDGWYGIFHQLGTKTTPARPIVPERIEDEDLDKMADVILKRAFSK